MDNPENDLINDLEEKLKNWFLGFRRAVIAGIGNSLRKDDFVGVIVARYLKGRVPPSVYIIECETVPESSIESVIELDPSHVLIIDAALLDLIPGASKFVSSNELQEQQAISTHALPLRLFCQYLEQTTEAEIALLLIQPEDTSFGEGLTQKLKSTAEQLARLLSKTLSE